MNETQTDGRLSVELEEAFRLANDGHYTEAVEKLKLVETRARSDAHEAQGLLWLANKIRDRAGDRVQEDCDVLISHASQYVARLMGADAARDILQEEARPSAVADWGFVLVFLVPVAEFFAWLGAGGINSLSGLLVVLAFFGGGPLFLGVIQLLGSPSWESPGLRVGLGLLLILWVAPLGALLATQGDYSGRDMTLTIVVVGGVPGLMGLLSLASGVRGRVRVRR